MEILFKCCTVQYNVMLRHEASATDETDSSYLRITEVVKKIATNSGAKITEEPLKLLY